MTRSRWTSFNSRIAVGLAADSSRAVPPRGSRDAHEGGLLRSIRNLHGRSSTLSLARHSRIRMHGA